MLLSLRSSPQTQMYIYKRVMVCVQAVWWALSNASSIVWICLAIHEILANKAFITADSLISQLFVVVFVYPIYMNSPHLGLSSTTWFRKIGLLVVKIQAEWSLWQNSTCSNMGSGKI